ncbi:MAG: hypothetical protein WD928_00080 [Gammaproteobacteria bacterium]
MTEKPPSSLHDVRDQSSAPTPPHYANAFQERYGESVAAIVLYGSYLRGKRDTVLDFYVLLDDYSALESRTAAAANRLLPPNVYHLVLRADATACAAKYATVTLKQFEHAIGTDFHTYFWSRFAQPFDIVYARDEAVHERVQQAGIDACRRMLSATLDMLPDCFTTTELWRRGFALTYGSELRSEDTSRAAELTACYHEHLEAMTARLAGEFGLIACDEGGWRNTRSGFARRRAALAWSGRRIAGKLLAVLRLGKAAFTFNDPLDYVLWKVERHSGLHMEATDLQRRHPLIFAWPLLWRLYRRGGFR